MTRTARSLRSRRRTVAGRSRARDLAFLRAAWRPLLPSVWVAGSQILAIERGVESLPEVPRMEATAGGCGRARIRSAPPEEFLLQVFSVSKHPPARLGVGGIVSNFRWTATQLLVTTPQRPSRLPSILRPDLTRHRQPGMAWTQLAARSKSSATDESLAFSSGGDSSPNPFTYVDRPWTVGAFRERARGPMALPGRLRRQILKLFSPRPAVWRPRRPLKGAQCRASRASPGRHT